MASGKSFSVKTSSLDSVLAKIQVERKRADKLAVRKMTNAVNIIHRIASARRPMITKAQMKSEGRRIRVSDPNAEAGVPVRTGALQASIQKSVESKVSKIIGTIWTDSPYASFIEFGTSKMPARPFMRPALALSLDPIKKMFEKQEDVGNT